MSPAPFEPPAPESLGVLLPAYEFESLIAVGGMGAVYKAKQLSLDRDVAIKILPREMSDDPEFRASFQTEARAMARLNHPNLIGVYDSGTVDGMLYIVMEYVAGKPLYYSSYGIQIDPIQAVELVQGICAGLAHAHENGIIHRDIKPANILLTPRAEPKIGDFGLAWPTDAEGAGLAMGTPGYTPPEVISHPHQADQRSDLFAVGVILYELLTGQRQEPNAPPPSTSAQVDARLDAIWQQATHPDPQARYPDAHAFSTALAEWRATPRHAGAAAASANRRPRLATPAPDATSRAARATPAPVPRLSQPRANFTLARNLLIIAGLVVAIVVVWGSLKSARSQRERENQEIAAVEKKRDVERAAESAAQAAARSQARPAVTEMVASTLPPALAPEPESPRETLERLRADLAAGKRVEFPDGTVDHGNSRFFLIDEPMSWSNAFAFAEAHGGHLALPTTTEEVTWIASHAPEGSAVWVGAGRSGREAWSLADGSPWPLDRAPAGPGAHAAIDPLGLVRATRSEHLLPFLIQWRNDGSNPGSLIAALEATQASITQGAPIFPPGTATFEHRQFLQVARPVTWQQATELAELAGGHLAVLASPAEGAYLAEWTAMASAAEGLWLGGKRQGLQWVWATGEPWQTAQWTENFNHDEDNAFLLLRPEQGWDAAAPDALASGFIIEWSNDPHNAAATAPVMASLDLGIADLTNRAKELIASTDKRRSEELVKNALQFARDMDGWQKGLLKGDQLPWQRPIESIKALIKGNRLPAEIPVDLPLSPQMAKIMEDCAGKERAIDTAFLAEIDKLRIAYIAKVDEAIADAASRGQLPLARELDAIKQEAPNPERWLVTLGMAPLQASDPPGDPLGGRWFWMNKSIVHFHPDGSASNEVTGQKGTWELHSPDQEELLYRLVWDNEWFDQITLFKATETISGKNQNGDRITGERIPMGTDPLVGAWQWSDKLVSLFRADGTVAKSGDRGTWKRVSEEDSASERAYEILWKSGFIDKLSLSEDAAEFTGTNSSTHEISGKRLAP